MTAGLFIGWYVHLHSSSADWVVSFGIRLFTLLFGVVGWAIGTVAGGRRLHCGGKYPFRKEDRERYGFIAILVVFWIALAALSLGYKHWHVYLIAVFGALSTLAGEIGWGNPLDMLADILGKGDKNQNDS